MTPETLLSEKTLFKGKVVTLDKQTVRLADGTTALREVVHTTGSAGVLALDGDRALFVSQWRAPLKQATVELPAGRIEVGEDPLVTATRELNEEAGLKASQMTFLTKFYQAAGFSDALCHLYLAKDLSSIANKRPQDIGEFVNAQWLTLTEAQQLQAQGVICDAKTILGLALWANMKG
jgi:ADP-ribose pyrophosphatase